MIFNFDYKHAYIKKQLINYTKMIFPQKRIEPIIDLKFIQLIKEVHNVLIPAVFTHSKTITSFSHNEGHKYLYHYKFISFP